MSRQAVLSLPIRTFQLWPLTRWAEAGLTFLFFTFLFSRGLLQTVLPKTVAMALQTGGTVAILTLFFSRSSLFLNRNHLTLAWLALAFVIEAFLSNFYTSYVQDFHFGFIYVFFNCLLLWTALLSVREFDEKTFKIPLEKHLCFWGWALFITALFEQLRFFKMPGHSYFFVFIRPASLTGSFLHYPILMPLIGFILMQWGQETKKKGIGISGMIFLSAPILTFSRSGVLILFITCLLFCLSIFRRHLLKGLIIVISALTFLGGAILFQDSDSVVGRTVNRFSQAANPEAKGNSWRIQTWLRVWEKWLDSNLLIGERTGQVTNSTGSLAASGSYVAESSLLQLLANFGLLGTLLFYGVLFYQKTQIAPSHTLLHHGFTACLFQTLVYQSIEVVAFITLLLLMPWFSHTIRQQSKEKEKNNEKNISSITSSPLSTYRMLG